MFNTFGVENRPKMRRACLNRLDSTLDLQWNKPTDVCGTFTHFDLYGRDNNLAVFQNSTWFIIKLVMELIVYLVILF